MYATVTISQNIQLGSGTPDLTLDGDDLYVTGTAEVDGDLAARTGGSATFIVAASDASTRMKNQADYVADGTADDVQIQAAIDALPAAGGKVVLSEGTFNIAASIQIPVFPAFAPLIQGAGMRKTILKLADNVNQDVITTKDSTTLINWLQIYDLTVDGNKDNNLTSGYGINLFTQQSQFRGIEVVNTRQATFRLFAPAGKNSLGNLIYGSYFGGISLGDKTPAEAILLDTGSTDNHIFDNKIRYADGSLILLKGGSSHIRDNHLSRAGKHGIELQGSWYNWIKNNWIDDSQQSGIAAIGNTSGGIGHNHIVDNKIRDAGLAADNTYDGISVTDGGNNKQVRYNYITGNMIWKVDANQVRYAIYLDATGSQENFNTVVNNVLIAGGFATGGIRTEGADDIVKGNRGFVTESSGTATINSGGTSVTVSHGLAVTPAAGDCTFVGAENPTTDEGTTWIDTYTSTQMNLNVENDPGASNFDVSWTCAVY